ncbi:MAG TPA: DUF4304 domain-containing protein [Candidatus Melainabacteria bacterium]|nr:DUF4304 domain-containing protein [Candidatus Melainabacteria bacterium]HMP54262.1 DUF4304 domain-containing protein [Candidatus Melainabacteria bacterium]
MDSETKQFYTSLTRIFKPHGFRRQRTRWYRRSVDCIQVVDLQKVHSFRSYHINLHLILIEEDEDIPLNHWDIHHRIIGTSAKNKYSIQNLLDLDAPISLEEREAEMVILAESKILPWFEKLSSAERIRSAAADGFIHRSSLLTARARKLLEPDLELDLDKEPGK